MYIYISWPGRPYPLGDPKTSSDSSFGAFGPCFGCIRGESPSQNKTRRLVK